MLLDQPPRPANMVNIVAINQGKRPYTTRDPDVPAIAPADAARLIDAGHALIDVRPHEAYAAGHVPRAVSVQLSSSSFEQNLGWILSDDRPFILVVDAPGDARAAAHKLAFVGLDARAVAFLPFGAWSQAALPVAGLPQIGVDELSRELGAGRIRLLDVRDRTEWEAGHIAASLHANFRHLPLLAHQLSIAPDETVAVTCAGGMRSATACGLLRERGFGRVVNVRGGLGAWRAAGLPVVLP
jgi:hydroxyacylglutathione hydrolase